MTPEFTGRVPTLWHGRGVARQLTKRLTAGRETLVIADSALTVPVLIAGSARTVRLDARSIDVTTVVTIAQEIVRRPPEFTAANANVRYKLPTGALFYNRSAVKARLNTKLLIRKPWLGRC